MKRPFWSWRTALSNLGLTWKKRPARRQVHKRQAHAETLESRRVMTTVTVDVLQPEAGEYGAIGWFVVSRDNTSGNITVNLSNSGTATLTTDYTCYTSVLIPSGDSSASVPVTVVDDNILEGDETSVLQLEGGTGYSVGSASQATITIIDDESSISAAAPDSSAVEEGGDTGTFTLTRSGYTSNSVTVAVTLGGTATNTVDYSATVDYSTTTATITTLVLLEAGSSSATITISPIDDTANEGQETAVLQIGSGGTAYQIGSPSSATVTIADEDEDAPTLQVRVFRVAVCPTCPCPTCPNDLHPIWGAATSVLLAGMPAATAGTNYTYGSGIGDVALVNNSAELTESRLIADALLPNGATGLQAVLKVIYNDATTHVQETVSTTPAYFNTTAGSGNDWYRFSLPIPTLDDSNNPLPSGAYSYELKVTTTLGTGPAVGRATGSVPIVNWDDFGVGLGDGWMVGGMPRLLLKDADPDGVLDGDDVAGSPGVFMAIGGSQVWFPRSGGGFGKGDGDYKDFSLAWDDIADEYTISSPAGDEEIFSAAGLLVRKEDKRGNTQSYGYSSGKISTITEADGRQMSFTYTSGVLSSITDGFGNTTSFAWSSGEQTVTYPDPDAGGALNAPKETFTYNANGTIASRTVYPSDSAPTTGETTTFSYNATSGALESITTPNGRTTEITSEFSQSSGQGSSGTPFALTKSEDVYATVVEDNASGPDTTTRYKYNEAGQVAEQIQEYVYGAGPTTVELVTTYLYYTSGTHIGRLLSVTTMDPDGNLLVGEEAYTTTYDYNDASGLIENIIYPDTTTDSFFYEDSNNPGLVTKIIDREERTTIFTFDTAGNRIRTRQVVGTADTLDLTNHPYNDHQDDVVVTWEYNTPVWNGTTGVKVAGLPSAMIVMAPNGAGGSRAMRTEYGYNSTGHMTSQIVDVGTDGGGIDYANATTTWEYNSKDQLIKIISPLGQGVTSSDNYFEEFAYDGLGRMTTHTLADPDGASSLTRPVTTTVYDRQNRPIDVVDPVGRHTYYVYQTNGSYSTSLPDHDSNGLMTITVHNIDERGRLVSIVDPMNYTTTYTYDNVDRQTSVTTPDPDLKFLWSSGSGWTQGSNGSATAAVRSTTYDNLGRVQTTTDALGNVTDYLYRDNGNTVEVRQPSAGGTQDRLVTITKHDAGGNVTHVIEGKVAYNAALTTAATELRWTLNVYNDLGQLIEVHRTKPDATTAPTTSNDFLAEQYTYDKSGNMLTSVITINLDGSGDPDDTQTTSFVYDARGNLLQRTEQDPDGTSPTTDQPVWSYTYSLENQMLSMTDAEGKTIDYTYDRLGRARTTTLPDPDGAGGLARPVFTTAYDSASRVTRQDQPNGNDTNFVYDTVDRQYSTRNRDSSDTIITRTDLWFDANGRLSTKVIGNSRWNYDYDTLGNLKEELQPDPDDAAPLGVAPSDTPSSLPRPLTKYVYDANSNVVEQWNELNKKTAFAYDNLGRLTTRTDPDPDGAGSKTSPVTNYSYDVYSRRTNLNDPVGNDTSWAYDLLDRQVTETNELSEVRSWTYNVRGDMLTKTDRNGRVVTWTYDLLGRVIDEAWDDSPATHYAFAYDRNGRTTSADGYKTGSADFSDYDYVYNPTGWLTSQVVIQDAALKSTLTPSYDVNGRRTSLKASFSTNTNFTTTTNDFENTYGFDAVDRLTSITQQSQSGGNAVANKHVVFGYDATDALIDIDRYANTTATNLVAHTDLTRDYLGRITGIDHLKGATTFSAYDLTWDARSRLSAIDETFSTSAWEDDVSYTYDYTDQLTGASHAVQTDETYGFDANGNRDGTQTNDRGALSSTVGTNNRISSIGSSGTANSFTFSYDDEGNLISKTDVSTGSPGLTEVYTYDHRNRLVRVSFKSTPSGAVTQDIYYSYDHNNQLIRREVDADGAGGGGITSSDFFVMDGGQIVLHFTKGSSGDAALKSRFLWGPQVDQLLADEQVTSLASIGTVYWALADHLGTPRDFATYNSGTDTTTIAKHLKHDSFGALIQDTATGIVIIFGWTARYTDATTDLQYNTNRWYVTTFGVWMQEDPIGFEGGTENLREYVANDPVAKTDPTGLAYPNPHVLMRREAYRQLGQIGHYFSDWWYYANPFSTQAETNCVDGVDAGLRVGTRVGQAAFVIGSLGASIVYATSAGGVSGVVVATPSVAEGTGSVIVGGSCPAAAAAGTTTPATTILFGHGARHLIGTALSRVAVENAIRAQVLTIGANIAAYHGWVQIGTQWIQYRAYALQNGVVNVGTYFPVAGPGQ